MAYDLVEELPSDRAAIVVYRNLQDTVRTHFSEKSGTGVFLEAPLQAYYGTWIFVQVVCFIIQVLNTCSPFVLLHVGSLFISNK